MCLRVEIPYQVDSAALFERIADASWAVFLDSGRPGNMTGRYDILAADPYLTLTTRDNITEIHHRDKVRLSPDDPFALLREALAEPAEEMPDLPFCGGAIGWFSYDLGRRIERLPEPARDREQLPEMVIGLYDWAVVVDHQQRRSWLVGQGRDQRTRKRWWSLIKRFCLPAKPSKRLPFRITGPTRSNMDRATYGDAFDRIKRYIREGDCYQVNFAQRFSAPAEGDGWSAYQELRSLNAAPFSAYLRTPYAEILSSSPERFLKLTGQRVETKPIKGTRPRGDTPEGDSAMARELAASTKDRAENLMIVDLLRNDIGRVCQPGSVRVPKLFAVESYATVHHLVSTVTGELAEDQDASGLLRACFPGGSITGAPKIRAMEIITELEPDSRGLYCGSIGYISFDGQMDSNIAIRTLVYNQGEIRCWAGGGIVHDSDVDAEYQETFDKASALLQLLNQNQVVRCG
ncbi:aminodeoxychorismate synthase component I [Sedimenticola thiotaurini]|uniref:aminodeoxychorismate synthase n=1 Tax=Sedimenticola thiotaurini TaxID=1543721 RepID=A0A0F7JWT5_9GAMM|nr:aminodeoxychorismate synthase component I [Sedimenticola thiotaurini]AKH19265.1 aminodeoxychorismate synthase [Sedimenticola thiotaurini]